MTRVFVGKPESAIKFKLFKACGFSLKNQFISSISLNFALFLIYCVLKRFISVSKLVKESILF